MSEFYGYNQSVPEPKKASPTPEELADLRLAHNRPYSASDGLRCRRDLESHPCPTIRLLDALEAATNRWQGMARQWHEQEIAGLTYRAEQAERERDAARGAIALARGVLVTDWDTAAAYDILERAYIAAQPAAPATEEEARVHAVIDTSHRRMLARVSQEEPENCTRCSFKRTNPHQHPGDPWPWNAAPATDDKLKEPATEADHA